MTVDIFETANAENSILLPRLRKLREKTGKMTRQRIFRCKTAFRQVDKAVRLVTVLLTLQV